MHSTKDIKYYGDKYVSSRVYDIIMHHFIEQSDGSYLHCDGDIFWYNEAGLCHREDGPSLTLTDGRMLWYLNGIYYSFDEWCIKLNKSDEEKMMLRLQYG